MEPIVNPKKFVHNFCEGCDQCLYWAHTIYDCPIVYDAYVEQLSDEERKNLEIEL